MIWSEKVAYIKSRRYHYLSSKHKYKEVLKYITIKVELRPEEVKDIMKKYIQNEDMATYDLENFKANEIADKYFISTKTAYQKIAYYRANKNSPI